MTTSVLSITTSAICTFTVAICYIIADCIRGERTSRAQLFLSIMTGSLVGGCIPNIVNFIANK